jgi:hypothetical protein
MIIGTSTFTYKARMYLLCLSVGRQKNIFEEAGGVSG